MNVYEYDWPFPSMPLAGPPVSPVTVCGALSLLVQVTVVPALTVRFAWPKEKFWMSIDTDAGAIEEDCLRLLTAEDERVGIDEREARDTDDAMLLISTIALLDDTDDTDDASDDDDDDDVISDVPVGV